MAANSPQLLLDFGLCSYFRVAAVDRLYDLAYESLDLTWVTRQESET
jgi:hypothetical protein